MNKYDTTLNAIIQTYDSVVKVIDGNASSQDDRSYGGMIRAAKGKLQEYITHSLIMLAWKELNGKLQDIDINSKKISIPINKSYLEKLDEERVKKYIESNIEDYHYGLSVDKQVFIKNDLVLGVECKSYTENAMIKRILVDFDLLKTQHPKMECFLFQLESQLGGDYSKQHEITYGSKPTHTIMSYFNFKLNIITLLDGERRVDKPIHKHFKPLCIKRLEQTKDILKKSLSHFV